MILAWLARPIAGINDPGMVGHSKCGETRSCHGSPRQMLKSMILAWLATPSASKRDPGMVGQGIQAIVCLNGRGQGGGPRDSSNCLPEWAGPRFFNEKELSQGWAKVFKQLFA